MAAISSDARGGGWPIWTLFIAVTGRSETNILAAMLAKRMGVKKVIAEIENLDYINLAESIGIDTIINKETGYGVEHLPLHGCQPTCRRSSV